jgi:hypothetical protein
VLLAKLYGPQAWIKMWTTAMHYLVPPPGMGEGDGGRADVTNERIDRRGLPCLFIPTSIWSGAAAAVPTVRGHPKHHT